MINDFFQLKFFRLLVGFRSDSALHKEMLAILAALTEVIKERGGGQTSTEYFLALVMLSICYGGYMIAYDYYITDGDPGCCQRRQ